MAQGPLANQIPDRRGQIGALPEAVDAESAPADTLAGPHKLPTSPLKLPWLRRLACIPIPILLLAMAVLWAADLSVSYGSNSLIMVLNFVFTTMTSGLIVLLVSRSFLTRGTPGLLLLGCGVLTWGAAGLLAKAANQRDPNLDVTVHNSCVWLSALFHLTGALLLLRSRRALRARELWLGAAYAGVAGVLGLVVLAALHGYTPTFFAPGAGGTSIRQWVLGSAIVMFLSTAGLLKWSNPKPLSAFLYWYILSLCLIALGLFGIMIESVFASLLSWMGLTAQYLSGIYMLIATIASVRESGRWSVSLEEALWESERRFVALAAATFEGIAIAEGGRFVEVNERLLQMLGFSREELIGTEVLDRLLPEDRARIGRLIDDERESAVEHHVIRKDGSRILVEAHGRTVDYQNRKVRLTAIRDITERKRTEDALRKSEQRLRSHVENSPMAVVEWDRDFIVTRWAGEAEKMFGWSAAQTVGRPIADLHMIYEPDIPIVQGTMARLTDGVSTRVVASNRNYTKDGRIIHCTWHNSVLLDEHGKMASVLSLVLDTTERTRAEEALRLSEERYRSAFDTMTEGFCIIEVLFDAERRPIDYRFLEINPAFEAQTGLHDAQGKLMRDLAPNHEAHWFEIYGKVALTGEPTHFVNEAAALGRWYEVRAYRVGDTDSHKVAILFNDITGRKQAEDDLSAAKLKAEQARAAAEAASKAKDHFIAVLSHELRNPLNPVLATASMLREDPRLDADTREQLDIICRNAEMEARLIDDLLDVTRIERGKVELDRRPVELRTIIRRAIEVWLPDINARKLEFGVDAADGPYPLDADAARIQQVFWNLLSNAIKFTPPGGCVGIRCRRDGTSFVVVEVNDSGKGIEPDALGRIFDPFEQAERSITRQFGGLGLGLTISKAMVELHGGTIDVHSEGKGKGTTFTVRLPLLASQATPLQGAAPGQDGPPGPTKVLRILLVEDHADTARIMRRLLSADGHEVQTAADVATALQVAERQTFDLMLSDLGLPDGSGLDVMRTLRQRGLTLPGIALTGYGQEHNVQQTREAGFAAHLTKPVSMSRLRETIHAIARGER